MDFFFVPTVKPCRIFCLRTGKPCLFFCLRTDKPWRILCGNCRDPINSSFRLLFPHQCPGCKAFYYFCGIRCQFVHGREHVPICTALHNMNCDKEEKSTQFSKKKSFRLPVTEPDGSCVICSTEINLRNRFRIPACKHEFCYDCLRMYQFNTANASCPICRGDLPEDIAAEFLFETALFIQEAKSYPEGSGASTMLLCTAQERIDFICKSMEFLHPRLWLGNALTWLENDPLWYKNHRMWRNLQADIFAQMGRYKEAIAIVSKHFKDSESTPRLQFHELEIMTRSLMKIKCVKGATALLLPCLRNEQLLKTIRASGNLEEFCNMLAKVSKALYEHALLERARRHFNSANRMLSESIFIGTTAIEMNPHCSGVYEYLALAHEKLGNVEKAMITLERAIENEETWNTHKVAENRIRLRELTVRAVAAKERADRELAERSALLRAEAARRKAEAAHHKAESERKRWEFAKAKEVWRRENEQARAKAEAEDIEAGRIRLADLDDDDFYFGTRKKRKGRKARKNRWVIAEEQLLGDSLDGLASDAHNEGQVQTDGEKNERLESHGDIEREQHSDDSEEEFVLWRCECCRKNFKSAASLKIM